jgi:CDP-diacylglycerol--glycerol-3-phosphate 3-phosphatidyltransferase
MTEVGAITVSERPTRVIVVAVSLLAAGVRPDSEPWGMLGAALLLGVGLVGLAQLLVVVRRALGGAA